MPAPVSVRVHHLNCGTMCPLCQRLINDRRGAWTTPGHLVCHCLLIETPETLVLVDTGMGLKDIAEPRRRLGPVQPALFRARLDIRETAFEQVKALGYSPSDVRHILPTHLDGDHTGGLADFPAASVHVLRPELEQIQRPGLRERLRFHPATFEHGPRWAVHEPADARLDWFGFASLRPLPGVSADIRLVPLPGHTRGHAGVAVQAGGKWLLHCGDAYYHASQLTDTPATPAGMDLLQRTIASSPRQRRDTLAKLQALARHHGDAVEMFCAHAPDELARYQPGPQKSPR